MKMRHELDEPAMPILCQIRADGEAVERWEIGDKPVIFGRGAHADVRVQDDRLSLCDPAGRKRFCRVRPELQEWDLGGKPADFAVGIETP